MRVHTDIHVDRHDFNDWASVAVQEYVSKSTLWSLPRLLLPVINIFMHLVAFLTFFNNRRF